MLADISVIINAYNRAGLIGETLQSLLKQTLPAKEIIVVDDGSTDRTSQIAEQLGAVVIQHKENMGYGQARQSAVEACQTKILAFIDDSCLISSEWFSTMQRDWRAMHLSIVALAGPMIPTSNGEERRYLNRNNPFTPFRSVNVKQITFFNRLSNYIFPTHSMKSGYIGSAANGNLSLRVEAISKIDGYNTELAHGGEDEDLCARIQEGYGPKSIYFDEDLWVTHDCESLMNTLQRNYRYGGTAARRWLRHGGVPTFLPIPFFFSSALLLSIVSSPSFVPLAFLFTYPLIISKGNASKKFMNVFNSFIDPYARLIFEIAHNVGFVGAVILSKLFLNEARQKLKVDKK